jgi:hypothetical protein
MALLKIKIDASPVSVLVIAAASVAIGMLWIGSYESEYGATLQHDQ